MDSDMDKGIMGLGKQRAFINLVSLVDIGGSGTVKDIMDNIRYRLYMDGTPNDLGLISSDEPVWRNYLRQNLRRPWMKDILVSHDGHNSWRITEKGKFELRKLCRRVIEVYGTKDDYILTDNSYERAHEFIDRYDQELQQTELEAADKHTLSSMDLEEPLAIQRVESMTYRILRDTLKGRRIKKKYRSKCQICGGTICVPNEEPYAEAHHIKPLGKNGPDVEENILCLCPNDHARLDIGAIMLDKSDLTILPGHNISDEYIDYHNDQIYRKQGNDIQ